MSDDVGQPPTHYGRPFVLVCIVLMTTAFGWQSAYGASYYDPELEFRTIESERFRVHYSEGMRNLAVRVSRLAEE
ncbi:MAG: hypothetical protein VX834_07985, partial [Myxococcota bacterium]|nr:hypothetical protein [Myxococcota bacterium]